MDTSKVAKVHHFRPAVCRPFPKSFVRTEKSLLKITMFDESCSIIASNTIELYLNAFRFILSQPVVPVLNIWVRNFTTGAFLLGDDALARIRTVTCLTFCFCWPDHMEAWKLEKRRQGIMGSTIGSGAHGHSLQGKSSFSVYNCHLFFLFLFLIEKAASTLS